MPLQPMVLKSLPGIKRDGTKFEGEYYVDGQWSVGNEVFQERLVAIDLLADT